MKRLILAAVVMVLLLAGVATVAAQGPQTTMRLLHVLVDAVIDGDLTIGDDLTVTDDGAVGGDLNVTGTISAGSTVSDGTIADNLIVTGTLAVSDTLTAVGDAVFGGTLTLANDETFANSVDGIITATVPATGTFDVSTGSFKVGNGEPTVTLNGEDAYIEGTLEVDGAVRLDSTAEINGNITLANDETIGNSVNGTIDMNPAAGGSVNILTGNLAVGNGTPGVTLNGEDAYIEGTFEVDGATQLDGALATNGLVTVGAGMNHATGAAVTVADGGTVNCTTRSVCELTAAGDVGASWATTAADGRIIYLFNSANHNIVITDSTGSLQATGNLTLAQWDAVQLVSDGTNWIQAAAVVNN
jgi:cytoskeletal protein CcmA (bactofilin family)